MESILKQAKDSNDFDSEEIRDLEEEMRHFAERREERDLLMGNDHYDMDFKADDKWAKENRELNLDDQLTEPKKSAKLGGIHFGTRILLDGVGMHCKNVNFFKTDGWDRSQLTFWESGCPT